MSANCLHWGQATKGRMSLAGNIWDQGRELARDYLPMLKAELSGGRLPFVTMPYLESLKEELPKVMSRFGDNFKHMLLLGIGGSALGPRALQRAFLPEQDWPGHEGPWLWIADNIDAPALGAWMDRLPPKDTLVVVISKSGGTIETMAQYFIVRDWLQAKLGQNWVNNVLVITDSRQGALRQEAEEKNLPSLPVPDYLGGRFSVLSAVGMVPAFFCGLDWQGVLEGAHSVMSRVFADPDKFSAHPAWRLAVWGHALMEYNYSQLIFFTYIPAWACFGQWFAQLWGESLGKSGKGSMPLPAVGVTDQHSLLQMFLDGPKDKACLFLEGVNLSRGPRFSPQTPAQWAYLRGKYFGDVLDAETIGTLGAFAANDLPLVRISLDEPDAHSAGRLIALLELSTLFTGWLLKINPLDQPAVEYGKRLANARLGASGHTQEEKDLQAYFDTPDETLGF
ncbi:MAG: glucose-6-phosphate isomerase [Deltaproteobacteria bacterium]|jgi:glucose-6-phosphate isomerase|nr:glucose-6-phosphate isomerase [Deltaproteobacteria bacterium]